jgi:hypothetical protein
MNEFEPPGPVRDPLPVEAWSPDGWSRVAPAPASAGPYTAELPTMPVQPVATGMPVSEMSDDDDGTLLPPPRRRRVAPLTAVLGVVVVAGAGFLGGVQVQKSQTPATSVRTGAQGAGAAGNGTQAAGRTGAAGAGGTGAAGAAGAGGGGRGTVGQVKLVDGTNIYVTDTSGNVVKVATGASSRITKVQPASVADVHPGDTVVIQGQPDAEGTVQAVAVNDAGADAGGFGGAFGRGGRGGGGAAGGAAGGTAGGAAGGAAGTGAGAATPAG